MADPAKRYSSLKYTLAIFDTFYLLVLLLFFLLSGLSKNLVFSISKISNSPYISFPLYLFISAAFYYCLSFPLNFYRSYILEHKFNLSTQKIADWAFEQLKSGILSYIIGLILIGAFYYILRYNPDNWWLIISVFWIFFSLILAKLVPTVIIPLFFKYKKL